MTNIQKIKSEIKLQITNLEAAKKEGFITEFGMGKLECLDGLLSFIDSELSQPMNKTSDQEKPAGDDFKAFEQQYMNDNYDEIVCIYDRYAGLVDGARWQKQQFEKNRLAACDTLTPEEAEIEQDFVYNHIDKNNRIPTFHDAIKYGIELQKQQMMKDALDCPIILSDMRMLFHDYEEKAEPCRQLLRRIMADIPTDNVLVALTHALQAVVDANGSETLGDTQRIQIHSLWLTAAAKDLLDQEDAESSRLVCCDTIAAPKISQRGCDTIAAPQEQ